MFGVTQKLETIMQLHGIHHLTAITADARANHAFYTKVLGMRLVKKTVNQDDVRVYHLFFADGAASPGTDLTFFEFPIPPEQRGTRSIMRTGLRVNGAAALQYWADRLAQNGVKMGKIETIDARLSLDFEDPEGQRFRLIDDRGMGDAHPYAKSPVPAPYQIRGLGPIGLSVPKLARSTQFLREVYDMRLERSYIEPSNGSETHVYAMGPGGPAAELHLIEEPDAPIAREGAGGVHHVAFRVADEAEYSAWDARYRALGLRSSGPVDRFYFRSLYVREPNGILFELATDGPGFATDEPFETMGTRLALPPFLEPRRTQIEAGLHPLITQD
jgi:glyoxalase family protein